MKKSNILKLAALGFALSTTSVFAQDTNVGNHTIDITVPEVALLDIETAGEGNIKLEGVAPTEAGNAVDFSKATSSVLWINYSSIIGGEKEPSRNVTAAITTGSVPNGMLLKVKANTDAGKGAGTMGTPVAAAVELSATAQDIITKVGSAYTGNGANAGHQLTYSLELDKEAYGKLDFENSGAVVVTYTLSDN